MFQSVLKYLKSTPFKHVFSVFVVAMAAQPIVQSFVLNHANSYLGSTVVSAIVALAVGVAHKMMPLPPVALKPTVVLPGATIQPVTVVIPPIEPPTIK